MSEAEPHMALNLSKKQGLQRGQSSVEYMTVSAFAVIVLLVADENGDVAVVQLANAIKTYYNAFAYALSYSNTITPF